jgi:hypothetical protein
MTKLIAPAAALAFALCAGPTAARADNPPQPGVESPVAGTLGVGAEYQLSGLGGVSLNYDAGLFHVGGFFGMSDPTGPNNTAFDFGGRFFFHLHRSATADFSIGGSVSFASVETGPNTTTTDVFLEPGFQIRWFAASNVALSFTGGFSFGLDDDKTFLVAGDVVGIAGIHYYFTK